jgi:hypothetical protein
MPVLTLPGNRLTAFCLPADIVPDAAIVAFVVADDLLASIGVVAGMVLVCRALFIRESPPDGSVCILISKEKRIAKLVTFHIGSLILSDDSGRSAPLTLESCPIHALALYACSCQISGASCTPITLYGEDVYASAGSALMRFNADAMGHMTYIDPRWMEAVGLPETAFSKWVDLLHPEDRAHTLSVWRAAVTSGNFCVNTVRVLTPEGYRWFTAAAFPIKDASGAIIRWQGYLQADVLAEKRA